MTMITIEKAHEIVFKKKGIVNLSKFFLGWPFFPWNSTGLFNLSGTGTSFTIYSGSSLVQFVIVFESVQA